MIRAIEAGREILAHDIGYFDCQRDIDDGIFIAGLVGLPMHAATPGHVSHAVLGSAR